MSIKIFVSYARKDEKLWELLAVPLSPLVSSNTIQLWNPHKDIVAGQITKKEIDVHLQTSQVFLLLLSIDYIADTECMRQMKDAVARRQKDPEHVQVIPIILRPLIPQMLRGTGLEGLKSLPRGKEPIVSWSSRDDAIAHVVGELYEIIDNIDKNNSDSGSTVDPSPPPPEKPNGGMDVGIIIALKSEFNVLFADIQKIHTRVYDADIDEYYYTFERSSAAKGRPYRCVVTFIGEGQDRATLQTQKMITRWNPTTLVLPGIAGSLSDRVRLGDIVIASQVDGYLVNAMANPIPDQPGYSIAPSGEVYRVSRVLLNATRNFDFISPELFQAWQVSCQRALQQLPLRPEDYATLIEKQWLREQAKIIEGHIASGSIVGAAPDFAKWLALRDRKYMAIEMEAVGLMTAVYEQAVARDTLIIRGISDLGDANKTELDKLGGGQLRTYAMRNAVQLLWGFLDAGLLQQKV